MKHFFLSLTRDPISLVGAAITTASAVVFVVLFLVETMGDTGGPYTGILTFLVLPGIFVLGLLIIPIGAFRARKRAALAASRGERPPVLPVIDLNLYNTRSKVLMFVLLTAANLVIIAVATYKGVEVMDSTEFCGQACHTVMLPEHTAYERSPHARVHCVSCHIGPGAGWFVKSKLSGAWQLVSVTFDLYPRPIPTPVHNLRPARDTCEQCHWPTKFVGDRLKVIPHYNNDEVNTETKTVLLLRVGGIQGRESQGIHWHVDPNIQIRYRADEKRDLIHEVELTDADGTVKHYLAEGAANGNSSEESANEAVSEWRVMDCVDCHNRPSHTYKLPEQEIDQAIAAGAIPRSLPYVRRESLKLLRGDYPSREDAGRGIREGLVSFYRDNYPEVLAAERSSIDEVGNVVSGVYNANVFPEMNVTWGTYPNHIGHEDFDGCFRCHNDEHATEDGETISQDCDTCHSLLAMEEEDPEILQQLRP